MKIYYNFSLSDETREKMFALMDKDVNGEVSDVELAQFTKSYIGLEPDVEDEFDIEERFKKLDMEKVFNSFDKNQDGKITSDEL